MLCVVLQPSLYGMGCRWILEKRNLLKFKFVLKTHLFMVAFKFKYSLWFKYLIGFYRHIIWGITVQRFEELLLVMAIY